MPSDCQVIISRFLRQYSTHNTDVATARFALEALPATKKTPITVIRTRTIAEMSQKTVTVQLKTVVITEETRHGLLKTTNRRMWQPIAEAQAGITQEQELRQVVIRVGITAAVQERGNALRGKTV